MDEYVAMLFSMKFFYEALKVFNPDNDLVTLAELMPSGGFSFRDAFWRRYPEEEYPRKIDAYGAWTSDLESAINSL